MDQHLSIFRPYDREPRHEDQLTRAALIVMRLVPLCQEAFLGLAGGPRLSELPRPRFDMQTESLVALDTEVEDPKVDELVSVFLGPHENLVAGTDELNLASERRARYDGVIQYGTSLMVVIESKLYAGASEQQAAELQKVRDELAQARQQLDDKDRELGGASEQQATELKKVSDELAQVRQQLDEKEKEIDHAITSAHTQRQHSLDAKVTKAKAALEKIPSTKHCESDLHAQPWFLITVTLSISRNHGRAEHHRREVGHAIPPQVRRRRAGCARPVQRARAHHR